MTDNLTVAIAGITVAVAASMGANAAYYAVNVDIVPERAATALGIMDFAFAIAGFLAPAVTGWVLNIRGSFTDGFLLMAVLALSTSLQDMRARLGRIVVGQTRDGQPVTAEQPDRDGACRDRCGLDQIEEAGAGVKPIERHQQHGHRVHMMTEVVQPSNCHERRLES